MDLNARDEEGRNVLWEVQENSYFEFSTIDKFIRVKADKPDKDGNTTIHVALCKYDDDDNIKEVLQVLVEAGVPPLAKNAKGRSALHVAGGLYKLKIVLSTPAFRDLDINEPDADGFTPLHHAVRLGEEAVRKLIRAGADPTALACGGLSPLHIAARGGEAAAGVLGFLLEQYRKLNALGEHVNLLGDGRAPLHYACRSGSPEAVWTLLHNGADPQVADEKGATPLHALAEFECSGRTMSYQTATWPRAGDIVGMLILAGADVNAEVAVQMKEENTTRNLTPLDMAVEKGCWEMVRRLIAHGAEPRDGHKQSEDFTLATDKKKAAEEARRAQAGVPRAQGSSRASRGEGPEWRGRWAAHRAHPWAKMLPEEKPRFRFIAGGQDILDAKAQNEHGDNNGSKDVEEEVNRADILHFVLQDGDYDTIKEYAQLGGDMLEVGRHGNTFLHWLVQEGRADLLGYFGGNVAEFEAEEQTREPEGSCVTLLGTACQRVLPSLHMVQLLVDKLGVDLNAVHKTEYGNLRGGTALHILASGSNFWQVEALEYLLSKGADIEARNMDGMTPLLPGGSRLYPDVGPWREETTRVLLRHGASLESCPDLLTRAVGEKWMEPGTVKLLLDAGLDPNKLLPSEETNVDLRYALHEAARPGTRHYPAFDFKEKQQAVVDLLISHGADAYARYPDGSFVLQAIVEDRGLISSLLSGLSQTNCNLKGHHGRTLLASACIPVVPVGPEPEVDWVTGTKGKEPQRTVMVDVVHALLGSGADSLAVDDEGRTPLHWLCTFPGEFDEAHRKAFVALARHGPAAAHTMDKQGRKPLHLALAAYASRSQLSPFAIQHLLSVGADPADPDPQTGNSALHFIAPRLVGESAVAAAATALFRELAARVDINTRNAEGATPVFSFAAAGWERTCGPENKVSHATYAIAHDTTHVKALGVFIDLGADLTAVDARKRTLLHITAGREIPDTDSDKDQKEDVESAFERLMELGVDPRREDDELRTAIDVAVAMGFSGIVRLFSEERKRARQEKNDKSKCESKDEGK
ncbi:hypothetical protein N0V88_007081 [Collariella sp. IMI 366227]|nr:hypothetical protein N0V88_007081 [Collariella sp. IMI 366227]